MPTIDTKNDSVRGREGTQPPDDGMPFGSDRRRSWTPVVVLGALYLAVALSLLWMAAAQAGGA
jgi:hypothetical protein